MSSAAERLDFASGAAGVGLTTIRHLLKERKRVNR